MSIHILVSYILLANVKPYPYQRIVFLRRVGQHLLFVTAYNFSPLVSEICSVNHMLPDIKHINGNYDRLSAS